MALKPPQPKGWLALRMADNPADINKTTLEVRNCQGLLLTFLEKHPCSSYNDWVPLFVPLHPNAGLRLFLKGGIKQLGAYESRADNCKEALQPDSLRLLHKLLPCNRHILF